jgi:hypothetical protein
MPLKTVTEASLPGTPDRIPAFVRTSRSTARSGAIEAIPARTTASQILRGMGP